MSNRTPVEAITREIEFIGPPGEAAVDGANAAYFIHLSRVAIAALELAKADAELISHDATEPKHPDPNVIWGSWHAENWSPWSKKREALLIAIQSARTKLYEALKQ